MSGIEVTRNLIGVEDLLLGVGTTIQDRGESTPTTITKINAANFPYDSDTTLQEKIDSLDSTVYVDENNMPLYVLTPHDSAQLNLVDVIWIKDISVTERHVYYYNKIMFKYNPTSGNLILDPALFNAATTALTTAFQNADTAQYNAIVTLINNAVSSLQTADSNIISGYQAADTALLANLNLGTAASKNVGTNAGNVVQLDNSSKLPAIDGSQLTNLPTATAASKSPLIKLFYSNNTATLINGSGQHQIFNPLTIDKGFTLFNVDYAPQASTNKLDICVIAPTTRGNGSVEGSNSKRVMLLWVNNTLVKVAQISSTNIFDGIIDLRYRHTISGGSTINIRVQIGGISGTNFYVNSTEWGPDVASATLELEEIKV